MANYNQFYHDSIKSVNDLFGAMNALNTELANTKKELETTKKNLLKLKKKHATENHYNDRTRQSNNYNNKSQHLHHHHP